MANNNRNNRNNSNSHNLRSNNSRNVTKSGEELSVNSSIVEQLFDENILDDQKPEQSFETYPKVRQKYNRENRKTVSNPNQTNSNSKPEVKSKQQIKSNQSRSGDKEIGSLSPPHLLTRSTRLKASVDRHPTTSVRRLGSLMNLTSLRRSTRIASTGISQIYVK